MLAHSRVVKSLECERKRAQKKIADKANDERRTQNPNEHKNATFSFFHSDYFMEIERFGGSVA